MLPAAYQLPAAALLIIGGLVACFFGYRSFKAVLGIFGFILGALGTSSVLGVSDTTWMVFAALLGGVVGALVLLAAYFVGVALVGAALGALLANLIWRWVPGDPHPVIVILFSVFGALVATWLQRYVIIIGTAFGGAWTLIVGAMAALGDRRTLDAAAAGDIWVAYPLNPAPGASWVPWAWVALGLVGMIVQSFVTAGSGGRVSRPRLRKKGKKGSRR